MRNAFPNSNIRIYVFIFFILLSLEFLPKFALILTAPFSVNAVLHESRYV